MGWVADVVLDSVRDTLVLVPFLLVTYLAMEAIEHHASERMERLVARSGAAGPVVGALLGALPQCGFSAMAATLFSGGVVSAGTLLAVVLSTSDEMVPVFLAHQVAPGRMLAIMAIKAGCGVAAGLALDAALRLAGRPPAHERIHELCERAGCGCDEDEGDGAPEATSGAPDARAAQGDGADPERHAHAHAHGRHGSARWHVVRSALTHTAQVTLFIFLVTLAFGLGIAALGQDRLGELLGASPVLATLLAALVGLIPNCGASVALSELYLDGTLAFGPAMAGLLASGGVGLLVLWRTDPDRRQSLALTALVYVVSVALGLVLGALGVAL